LGGLLHIDERKKRLVWEGNHNLCILHRLFLLPRSTEEGTYRCLHTVLQLSSLCASPGTEMVTKDLLTSCRQGSARQEGRK